MALCITWKITPLAPPIPHRHCPGCKTDRPFHCSGKVRLNANGRRLDAWLIYRCATCDRTWNLPLLDRVSRSGLSPADLAALHHSDPAWVRRHAFDVTRLALHCSRVDAAPLQIRKTLASPWTDRWTTLALTLAAPDKGGPRLDRLLGLGLGLPRADIASLAVNGAFGANVPLRKPVKGRLTLTFQASHLSQAQHAAITRGLMDRPPWPAP
jgi:hypothetical protein